jgi:chemotaxis signal transduction protein
MTDTSSGLAERAGALRLAFDRDFAAPLRSDTTVKQDLLAIRVGHEACAIRLSDVTGVFVDRRITRFPTGDAAFIGIAGFRGAIVPVYSLLALLGHSGTKAQRWLVIAASASVALAFDLFEGHWRVPADAILPQQANAQMRGYAPEFVRSAGVVRPVLRLASIVEALGASTPSHPRHNEE